MSANTDIVRKGKNALFFCYENADCYLILSISHIFIIQQAH